MLADLATVTSREADSVLIGRYVGAGPLGHYDRGNKLAIVGHDGWLFYKPGVLHVGGPGLLDADVRASRQKDALDAGCLFALDSDAHDVDQFWYTEIALAHAKLAGIPAARVINCWPTAKLIDWLGDR